MLGCAHLSPPDAPARFDAQRIAENFVSALRQLPSLQPATTMVHFDSGDAGPDDFDYHLEQAMCDAGYAVKMTKDQAGERQVSFHITRNECQGIHFSDTYEIVVGDVRLTRQFGWHRNGDLIPLTALFVNGAGAASVVLEDVQFARAELPDTDAAANNSVTAQRSIALNGLTDPCRQPPGNAPVSAMDPTDELRNVAPNVAVARDLPGPALAERGTTGTAPLTASVAAPLITQSMQEEAGIGANGGGVIDDAKSSDGALRPFAGNVFDMGESNYRDLLMAYVNLDEQILIFGNDSLRLGETNKAAILDMVENFDSTRDLFAIIGCSLGPTKIENGNQVLALGRANRVKEALVFAGVPQDRILDEGCWAGESLKQMPSRDVVLTHKRKR